MAKQSAAQSEVPSEVLRFKTVARAVQRNAEGQLLRVILCGFKAAPDGGEADIIDDTLAYRFVCSTRQYATEMGKVGPVTFADGLTTVNALLVSSALERCFIDGAEGVELGQRTEVELIVSGTVVKDFLVRRRE